MIYNLQKILLSSYDNSEYYKSEYEKLGLTRNDIINEKNFTKLPILQKNTLMKEFDYILHKDYKYLRRKDLHLIKTSGSTGYFVEVLWEPYEYISSNLCLWRRRKKWYGINPNSRKCSFMSGTIVGATISANYDSSFVRTGNELEISIINMSDTNLFQYYKEIVDFQPEWIYASPSSLIMFVNFCEKYSLSCFPSLKYIELASEQVLPSAYNYIRDFFNVPTSIMYGCKELNGIALTCPMDEKLHVLEDNVLVEQTKDGRILVTSMKNSIFPLIRYDLGDVIEIASVQNSERQIPIIESIKGRTGVLNYISNTTGVTTEAIINCIYVVDARLDYPLVQFKLFEKKNCFEIHLFLKKNFYGWEDTIRSEFFKCFDSFCVAKENIFIEFSKQPFDADVNTRKMKVLESSNM